MKALLFVAATGKGWPIFDYGYGMTLKHRRLFGSNYRMVTSPDAR